MKRLVLAAISLLYLAGGKRNFLLETSDGSNEDLNVHNYGANNLDYGIGVNCKER